MKKQEVKWWHEGIAFGLLMYLSTTLLLPFFIESTITVKGALIGIPVWFVGGLSYRWIIESIRKKQKRETE